MNRAAVEALTRLLGQPGLTVDDVSAAVGPVAADHGERMALDLSPAQPDVQAARLWRYPGDGLPYLLEVQPAPESAPTLGDLETILGPSKRQDTHRGHVPQIVFTRPVAGGAWPVTVIARLGPTDGEPGEAPVSSITFRRDAPDQSPDEAR